ncbi:uncharacterized protein LOC129609478 [Condylostylus longicornis]|uniref:uncharacterized protein LOC129609478 n=1 Tax=Condylostylus longicornis TaxID=2530218 RepID=UPI00244DCDB2|nr:uncharacterized protein LOC129609478 [Condylostylus longicornis]
MRRDIQWISLDDHTAYKNTSCKISFSNFMTKNTQETFTVKLMNNQNCTNATNFKSTRKSDICSLYVNPSICNLSDNHLMTSDDRGTGLVCDSKLIGILSQIIPIDNETECSNFKPFKAIYTRVANHLNWIYEKIAIESMADLGKSNYILAPQYKESAPSPSIHMPQEPQLLEKSSSTPVVSMSTDRTIKTSQDIDSSLPSNFENRTGTETKTNNKSETQTTKTGLGKSIGVLSKTICLPALSISIIISVLISKY